MEKYSKWRDPATGIQPFLPPVPPAPSAPFLMVLFAPPSFFLAVIRSLLLGVVALLYLLLDAVSLIFTPIPPLQRSIQGLFTAITCRLALGIMGYWWIEHETVSPKRGTKGVLQIADRSPQKGDLIVSNWTSYVDVLYLAFRHNPIFLLPVFSALPSLPSVPDDAPSTKFGRHTGTGSASIATPTNLPQPPLLGYVPVPLVDLIRCTGSLPPTVTVPLKGMYKTLKDARRKEKRPIVLFPEGTTGNGRALLRFGEGTLAEGDVGGDQEGLVWIKYLRHTSPTSFAPTATCSVPQPLYHLFTSLLWTPSPVPSRSLTVRTLHPSASPSSPSFLPSEILANTPGGLELAGRDGKGAWREATGVVLAETGRVRRVRLGWVEKEGFLEYWAKRR